MIWKSHRSQLDLSRQAAVMGILNVTPDSFSDGGRHQHLDDALAHAQRMIEAGAKIIDIGGESTRPGSLAVDEDEEIRRTLPVVRTLRERWDGWISIDTSKSAVAEAALEAGADVVNDVTGLRGDPAMLPLCVRWCCAVVVMHMRGEPRTMQVAPAYGDVVTEVAGFFEERLAALTQAGMPRDRICMDPGIGFGKTAAHNTALLRSLDQLVAPETPLLLGVSRKSVIAALLDAPDPSLRDWPTVALTARARLQGVMLHRVHAVLENFQAIQMIEAILAAPQPRKPC
jgi:dihydropteroate synthase